MRVSVIGLGKLGLPMAGIFAAAGYPTIGVDQNRRLIDALSEGECPIEEPGLPELLKKAGSNLKVTDTYPHAILDSDVSFIIVPTPSGGDHRFKNDYVVAALEKIALILRGKRDYHLIVVTSTVMPGSCADVFKPLIEEKSGRRVGEDVGLCYSPEFIALGNVIDGMRNPDAVLIGESDRKAGDILQGIYRVTCGNKPPIVRMDWLNAEIAKLALNVFITTKISLANTFAEVCQAIPGGDVDKVTDFIGLDSRIGRKYLRGGLGFSGPCFPRDVRAFATLAKAFGVSCPIQKAVHSFNRWHNRFVFDRIMERFKGKAVTILGLTYKPHTPVVEESPSLDLVRWFRERSVYVSVYDPEGMDNARLVLGEDDDDIYYAVSMHDALICSDMCVIATPWPEFRGLKPEDFRQYMVKPRVFDCWRFLDGKTLADGGVEYYALGVNR